MDHDMSDPKVARAIRALLRKVTGGNGGAATKGSADV